MSAYEEGMKNAGPEKRHACLYKQREAE